MRMFYVVSWKCIPVCFFFETIIKYEKWKVCSQKARLRKQWRKASRKKRRHYRNFWSNVIFENFSDLLNRVWKTSELIAREILSHHWKTFAHVSSQHGSHIIEQSPPTLTVQESRPVTQTKDLTTPSLHKRTRKLTSHYGTVTSHVDFL